MNAAADPQPTAREAQEPAFGWRDGWRYGLMGFPLAFVALPLYVVLPNYYARAFGVPLATLGAVLLGARLFDALIDPLLGRWSDRLYRSSTRNVLGWGAGAAALLGLGFAMLFFPPVSNMTPLLVWVTFSLLVTYVAFSLLSILHQSWGAMLGGDEAQRGRIVAWREGLGLLGVILASIAPVALGLTATTALFFVALALGWWAWSKARAPRPPSSPATLQGDGAGQHRSNERRYRAPAQPEDGAGRHHQRPCDVWRRRKRSAADGQHPPSVGQLDRKQSAGVQVRARDICQAEPPHQSGGSRAVS